MRQVSIFFAAILLFAVVSSSPVFASKCYGLDPCNACRNCSACKHCHVLGGTCGICKTARNASVQVGKRLSSVRKNTHSKKSV